MFRFGLLGCGRIGQMHADNLSVHPRAMVSVVFDVDKEKAEIVARKHGAVSAQNAISLFSHHDLDAVIIASATPTHADLLELAVSYGCPVFCEKPIDLDLKRVEKCKKAILGSNVPIQLGFNRRFDPGHRAAREAYRTGSIGDLHQVIISSRDPEVPPREYVSMAGGLLRDMTIHDFDLARFMLSDEPAEIFALGNALADPDMGNDLGEIDTAMIIMRTKDGKQCHINNSRSAIYGYDQRVELVGSQGMILSDNRKPHETKIYKRNEVESSTPYLYFFIERYAEAFMAEIDAFITSIETGTLPEVGFEDGRKALLLAEAAYISLAEKRLVQMSEIESP